MFGNIFTCLFNVLCFMLQIIIILGKGYEEEYFYSNSKVFHLALENIHIVRISYHKICNLYWNNLNSQV
jgi:hypothetical protein